MGYCVLLMSNKRTGSKLWDQLYSFKALSAAMTLLGSWHHWCLKDQKKDDSSEACRKNCPQRSIFCHHLCFYMVYGSTSAHSWVMYSILCPCRSVTQRRKSYLHVTAVICLRFICAIWYKLNRKSCCLGTWANVTVCFIANLVVGTDGFIFGFSKNILWLLWLTSHNK